LPETSDAKENLGVETNVASSWFYRTSTLEVSSRTVTRDITSCTLPDNLEEIVKIFVGILE
jgi:hypothetical protein